MNNPLNPTQLAYLDMLVNGFEIKEIGRRFGVSKYTAYWYLRNIRKILGARTNPQAAAIGVARGLVSERKNNENMLVLWS